MGLKKLKKRLKQQVEREREYDIKYRSYQVIRTLTIFN